MMNGQQSQSNGSGYESRMYVITARTNMHAGSGEEAFGLIDNRVQRDVLSGLPNINASGVKGSLREYYSQQGLMKENDITRVFGSDTFANPTEHRAGEFRFFNANLLSMPVRSNVRPFFRAVSPMVIEELTGALDTFGFDDTIQLKSSLGRLLQQAGQYTGPGKAAVFTPPGEKEKHGDILLEDFEVKAHYQEFPRRDLEMVGKLMGSPLALVSDEDFSDLSSDYNLPLIARNHLENGRSKNLWHEQVVPRESKFYFFILHPKNNSPRLEFPEGRPVQIGANAGIGYGFCRIEDVESLYKPARQ